MSCSLRDVELPRGDGVHVNGVAIPRDRIAREVQHHPSRTPIEAWQAAARALVVRELLLQEARRLGIAAVPQRDEAGRRETEEEALIRGLVEREVTTPAPDGDACRRYYEQNRGVFRTAAIYEAAHILLAARRGDDEAYAHAAETAGILLDELKRDPARFSDLARSHSACPSAAQGGNLGQLTRGQTTPEFEAALVALPVGAITAEPIATDYGLHIIRLDRKIEGRQLPFEIVAERIAEYLRENVIRLASAQYIARLMSRAAVTGVTLEGAHAHRVS
jgi:peptidyl-prolyl cis-trans isomerase C